VLLPLNAPPSAATRDERRVTLEQVDLEVRDCRQCDELATTRTKTVFGVGDPAARILFLGEAPGADEDRQGEPFVGAAGQLLNSIIEACRLTREEIYICNVLKCRPPGNRVPHLQECRNCRPFLDRQLATVDPDFIICWGTVAAQNLLQTTQALGKLRRQFFRHGRARVLCTYHPSYLLRTPSAKKDVWEDMKLWRLEMGSTSTRSPRSGDPGSPFGDRCSPPPRAPRAADGFAPSPPVCGQPPTPFAPSGSGPRRLGAPTPWGIVHLGRSPGVRARVCRLSTWLPSAVTR